MDTTSANQTFLPSYIGPLVITPALARSVAAQVSTVVQTGGQVNEFRVPIVSGDPTADWIDENEEITPSDATFDETDSKYRKLAALTRISNELAEDTDPAAQGLIGAGLARDLARKVDNAFFGDPEDTVNTKAPDGLETITSTAIDADGYANLDPFEEALAEADDLGVTLTSWVTDPTTARVLRKLKESDTSNRDLLGSDPTLPTRRQIKGLPLFVSPYVVQGVTWGIPRDVSMVAMRKSGELVVDRSRYLEFDQTAIRAITRCTFAFPHEAALMRIADSGS